MKYRLWPLLGGVAVLATLLALVGAETRVGRALERRVYDGWFTIRGSLPRPDEVVVVAIDLDSEQSLGRYPWSRDWHTRLIRNLHRAGARVVAFDATFADAFPPQDTALRRAIDETGTVVLGAKTDIVFQRNARGRRLEEPAGVLRGAPIGMVDLLSSPIDGLVREYPVLQELPQGRVPQLGFAALLHYLGLPADSLRPVEGGWRLGGRFIPRGPFGGMLVDFVGPPGSVATYSYADVVDDAETDLGDWDLDVFEDHLAEGRFRDRIILVGSTVPEHGDLHPTPFRDVEAGSGAILTPGVEIHAHAVATALTGTPRRPVSFPAQAAWTALLAALLVATAPRLQLLRGAAFGALLAAGALFASWWLFSRQGLWLGAVAPLLGVGLTYTGSAAVLYFLEEQEKTRIRGMFQQYVSASVVDELIKRPELLRLGGEERVLSVLFSDIAGFSAVSEQLTPTELVALLNEYLTAMTEIVLEHGGIIDKYQGDAIMAEFGAPLPVADHARRACRAALRMQHELVGLRERWGREGRPRLMCGVGINTGPMLVGNLGSRRIMDYTVMGDHVNLASRLEGTTRTYGVGIIVSEFTWREVESEFAGRELDRIRVKGKTEPVAIHELVGAREQPLPTATAELLSGYGEALALYRGRRFDEALAAFHALAERHPEDGPTRLFLDRCRAYAADPPGEAWDGVYAMTVK